MATIKGIDTDLSTLCLGGNVFGWTADESQSFAVLDAYVAAGGNFIDSADSYSAFVPGNEGGESETIIGSWLQRRGRRDDVVIATKVAKHAPRKGLAPDNIRAACDDSLRRLQTDYIDLYYAHEPDPNTPIAETLAAFGELVDAGKVRAIAASNYDAEQLAEALAVDAPHNFVALQPHYNLVERGLYEGELQDLVAREGLACVPYWALAKGFLTGKYREGSERGDSPRAGMATAYLNATGIAILDALDEVAGAPRRPGRRRRDRLAGGAGHGRLPDRERAQRRAARADPAGAGAVADERRARGARRSERPALAR